MLGAVGSHVCLGGNSLGWGLGLGDVRGYMQFIFGSYFDVNGCCICHYIPNLNYLEYSAYHPVLHHVFPDNNLHNKTAKTAEFAPPIFAIFSNIATPNSPPPSTNTPILPQTLTNPNIHNLNNNKFIVHHGIRLKNPQQ